MKNIYYCCFAALLGLVACTSKPSYEVKLKITGASGKAYLNQKQNGKWVRLDSVNLVNGEGSMKGVVAIPEVYYIEVEESNDNLPLFIENSAISIVGLADSLSKAKVSGSKTNDEYQALKAKIEAIDEEGNKYYKQGQEAENNGDKAKADSLKNLAEKLWTEEGSLQKSYIKNNPASFISPFVLSQIYHEMEADTLDAYLKGFDKKLESAKIVKTLSERVVKLKTVAVGQIAPDFTMAAADGTPVKLSDVYSKNEYTLVDFWASWCGPCRRENPNVVATYNEYKTKGFNVLGVSLDTKKENWLKAIEDDKLTWAHVSDLKGWQNEAAGLYAVSSIPSNLLIDKTGKIIARNLREEKLKETISGLLK
jgi:peroxiredoxin